MTVFATLVAGRRRFDRLTRTQLEARCRLLEHQRDLAIGAVRANRDHLAAWLDSRAAAYRHDADHLERLGAALMPSSTPATPAKPPVTTHLDAAQRRAIADELADAARDCDLQEHE